MVAVYIPPQADTDSALASLLEFSSKHLAKYPDTALIVAGDFNKAKLTKVMPDLFQHVTCPTRGENTLDHCYTQHKDSYKAISQPAFGKADHAAIFLVPEYKQTLRRVAPATREVRRWSDQSEATLQDALSCVEWDMFRESSGDDVSLFTEVVTDFIAKLIDDIVPTVTVKVFPNQKPWVDKTIREAVNARTTAYNEGLVTRDMSPYKAASYELRRKVKAAKRRYKDRVEASLRDRDSRRVWQGLRDITDYRGRKGSSVAGDPSLAEALNAYYARHNSASMAANANAEGPGAEPGEYALSVSEQDVRRALRRVNSRKAAGPDGIPGRVLKTCAVQLAPVFTSIFNLSLSQSTVPACFKKSTIVPVPKKTTPVDLNDFRPVALTSVVMKCFERLIKDLICASLPSSFDPLQFAYRPNRSTDDAINHVLHSTLTHLDCGKGNYVRMLFIDYSSAFNTLVPHRLVTKLRHLGINSTLCSWVMSFMTERPQVVRIGNYTSSPRILSIGSPQGCVLSPLLYSLYTHDCIASHPSNIIVKFADDTVVIGLISKDTGETAYLEEVEELSIWCRDNNLELNVTKTKEMVVDFRRERLRNHYTPLRIHGTLVEKVKSFRYLGVHITEDLTWTNHISILVKKARQRLFFLRRLRKFNISTTLLRAFYTSTTESVLTGSITAWYGSCTAMDRKALHRVIRCAERTCRTALPSLQDIYTRRCTSRAWKIIKDIHHPGNRLFRWLPSGKRLRSCMARTERMRRSFFPQAIRTLNTT